MSLVTVTGKCPHCEVRKHQISSVEHALQVVSDAIERHVAEEHPKQVLRPGEVNDDTPSD